MKKRLMSVALSLLMCLMLFAQIPMTARAANGRIVLSFKMNDTQLMLYTGQTIGQAMDRIQKYITLNDVAVSNYTFDHKETFLAIYDKKKGTLNDYSNSRGMDISKDLQYYIVFVAHPKWNYDSVTECNVFCNDKEISDYKMVQNTDKTVYVGYPMPVVTTNFSIQFNPGLGSGTMKTIYGIGEMDIPQSLFTPPSGQRFDHWVDQNYDTVEGKLFVAKNTTLRAMYCGPQNLRLAAMVQNGTVDYPRTVFAGDMATVTCTPDAGYKLDRITTTPSTTIKDNGNGTYTFTMPKSDVKLNVTFVDMTVVDKNDHTKEEIYLFKGTKYDRLTMKMYNHGVAFSSIVRTGTSPDGMTWGITEDKKAMYFSGTPTRLGDYTTEITAKRGDDGSYDYHTANIHVIEYGKNEETSVEYEIPMGTYADKSLPILARGQEPDGYEVKNEAQMPRGMQFNGGMVGASISGKPTLPGVFKFDVLTTRSDDKSIHTLHVTVKVTVQAETITDTYSLKLGDAAPIQLSIVSTSPKIKEAVLSSGSLPSGMNWKLMEDKAHVSLYGRCEQSGEYQAEFTCIREDNTVVIDKVTITVTDPNAKPAMPVITLSGDKVSITSSTEGAMLYYTINSRDPVLSEDGTPDINTITAFGGSVSLDSFSGMVKAITVKNGVKSDMARLSLVDNNVVKPVSFAVKGAFGGRYVTFNCETEGATIYYTTANTSIINMQDTYVKAGETVLFERYYGTVYARAYYNGHWSNVCRLILRIPTVNAPTITVDEKGYATIRTTTPSSYICYTTDGSEPSMTNGTTVRNTYARVYVGKGKTIKAMGVRSCFSNSEVTTYNN